MSNEARSTSTTMVMLSLLAASVLFGLTRPASTQVAVSPNTSVTKERLAAKRQMKEVLISLQMYASDHGGRFPTNIGHLMELPYIRLESGADIDTVYEYIDPEKPIDRIKNAFRRIVVYDANPDWDRGCHVGYVDGHVVLLRSKAALEEKLHQQTVSGDDSPVSTDSPEERFAIIHLTDEEGAPVAGAHVGVRAWFLSDRQIYLKADGTPLEITSNASGDLAVPVSALFSPNLPEHRKMPLYALHESRELTGLTEISRDDLDQTLQIIMLPASRVIGKVASPGLQELGRTLSFVNSYVLWGEHMIIQQDDMEDKTDGYSQFQFPVPPGEYKLVISGLDLERRTIDVQLALGQETLDLGLISLAPSRLATLFGKPAPDLQQIKAWKNGDPTTLADLRGRVVLLDFWGVWCGPCIRGMPALMDVHDDYANRGLVVVAVHDDSVDSLEELERKLEPIREQHWNGRELPFLIALDGGGPTRILGMELEVRGATTAAYGITKFPTLLLMDKQGILVKEIYGEDELIAELDRLLSPE